MQVSHLNWHYYDFTLPGQERKNAVKVSPGGGEPQGPSLRWTAPLAKVYKVDVRRGKGGNGGHFQLPLLAPDVAPTSFEDNPISL